MEIIPAAVQAYATTFTSPESETLYQLNRFTNLKVDQAHMLSGHVQGKMLTMISSMIVPDRILEIGTFTGYSAICLAAGLSSSGILYTIDINEELKDGCLQHFAAAGLKDKITLLTGKAVEIIPGLQETFDLVFIDADKINYAVYFDLVINKVRPGGYILADNVLFHGEVLIPEKERSANAKAIHAFNQKIAADERVEQVLLTIRDGLLLIRKK
jgi:predicted O-methyltransferase YrrM